jgi:N-methylhydantoinase B
VRAAEKPSRFDGVALAVLRSRFEGIVETMSSTMLRTARSNVINTAHDFSCCILTARHEHLAMANSLPIHVMTGPDIMARYTFEMHLEPRRGDAYLHNSPYHGNSHAADHSILVPVVDDTGCHRFTVFAKAHQADCGNSLPTTYMAAARDVYEEGALIFPAVKVQQDYEFVADTVRTGEFRIRAPHQWKGDLLALVGSARIGERLMLQLGAELGWDALDDYTSQWFAYSERAMVEAISALPKAQITVTTSHDPFPNVPDGVPITVTISVDPDDARIEIDLRDNPDCLPCGLNTTESTARNGALIGVFNSLDRVVPNNSGSFRRVTVHLRENCAVGIPRHPASCSVATTALANRVGNAVQRAMAELREGIGMGEIGPIMSPTMAVISGNDPRRDNQPFVNQLILGHPGGAGGHGLDGWLTIGDLGAGAMLLVDSVEVAESNYPIRVLDRRIAVDSEGAGRNRGAPGTFIEFEPVDCTIDALYTSDGSIFPALGARGGQAGLVANQFKRERSGELTPLPVFDRITLEPGTSILSRACGGGGYGPPLERDPARVREDVIEGWITPGKARNAYGLVLGDDGEIDLDATAALRAGMAGKS